MRSCERHVIDRDDRTFGSLVTHDTAFDNEYWVFALRG